MGNHSTYLCNKGSIHDHHYYFNLLLLPLNKMFQNKNTTCYYLLVLIVKKLYFYVAKWNIFSKTITLKIMRLEPRHFWTSLCLSHLHI